MLSLSICRVLIESSCVAVAFGDGGGSGLDVLGCLVYCTCLNKRSYEFGCMCVYTLCVCKEVILLLKSML